MMKSFGDRVEIVEGDITKQMVDAIVNAANNSLLGGGGVDGAIHRAAGKELLLECMKLGGCPTGQAKLTKGYRLPSKYVIHTVGPVYKDGKHNEAELLANCYWNCLKLAVENNIKTIAFPAISAGAYGYPLDEAARIAMKQTKVFLEKDETIKKVIFVCFRKQSYEIYKRIFAEIFGD